MAACSASSDTSISSPLALPKTNTSMPSSMISPSLPAAISPGPGLTPSQASSNNQQVIVDDILKYLKQQGVPVISSRLVNFNGGNPPIEIEFTLQSASGDLKGTPDDPINIYLVRRTADLAQIKGLNIGAIGIVIINNQGQKMSENVSVVTKVGDLPPLTNTPSPLDDTAVANLLKQKISLSSPSTVNIKVIKGIYGLREADFDIQVPDLATANNNIGIIKNIKITINNINLNHYAQISDFRIYITDAAGNPLLRLMGDSRGSETGWHAEGLANWGYPQPPPTQPKVSPKQSDFNFIFKWGVSFEHPNELNTFNGTFTKDMILDPSITTNLVLSQQEIDRIYQKIMEIDLMSYPYTFKVNVPPGSPTKGVTPSDRYYFKVNFGSQIKEVSWDDRILNEDAQASKLRSLCQLIINIIQSKEEYKILPTPKGGYL